MQVIIGKPQKSTLPIRYPAWTSYTNGNFVSDLLVEAHTIWTATSGGVVCWDRDTGEYVKLTTEHGLASNQVYGLCRTPDGTLWFRTLDSGLCAFQRDGTWRYYNGQDPFDSNRIQTLFLALDGSLWVSTPSYVYCFDQTSTWRCYDFTNVVEIYQSRDEALWFGLFEGGVLRLDRDQTVMTFDQNDAVGKRISVYAIYQAADDAMWFGGYESGLRRLDKNGTWSKVLDGDTDYYGVTTIVQDAAGTMWFGSFDGIRRRHNDGTWQHLAYVYAQGDSRLIPISRLCRFDSTLWLALWGDGIMQLGQDLVTVCYLTADPLASNQIQVIRQSNDQTLWFGTAAHGVSSLTQSGEWHTITQKEGLCQDDIQAILPSRDGALWFGTGAARRTVTGGLSRYTVDQQWTTWGEAEGLASLYVKTIAQRADDSIWFAVGNHRRPGGIHCLQPDGQCALVLPMPILHEGIFGPSFNQVNVIFASTDGALWVGMEGGIGCFDRDNHWHEFVEIDNNPVYDIVAITQTSDETLWFVSAGGGIWYLTKANAWHELAWPEPFCDKVTALYATNDGAIWFGTTDYFGNSFGLYRLDPNHTWTMLGTRDGLATCNVNAIYQSSDGALWFGTNGGISCYQPFYC